MGTIFAAHQRSKTTSNSILSRIIETIRARTSSTCFWHRYWWWTMVSSLWFWNQTTMKNVHVKRWSLAHKSSGKWILAIFFIKSGLIESITLESGASISAWLYVTNCLFRVFDAVAQRREKTELHGLILHHDNARPHWVWMTTEYLAGNSIKSYQNPSYSPKLSLCDFFLF